MSNEWYKNIPPQGVLVKIDCGYPHPSIIRIMSYRIDVDDIYFTDDNGIEWRDGLNNPITKPITAAEWWDFAPWQGMKDAPFFQQIMVIDKENIVRPFTIMNRKDIIQLGLKKWLPLPV